MAFEKNCKGVFSSGLRGLLVRGAGQVICQKKAVNNFTRKKNI